MSRLWINGTLIDKAEARVSPFDHGFLYGDGVWEHLRVFGGHLFRPIKHLNLLFTAARAMGIDIPLSLTELVTAIEAAVRANDRTDGYIRVIVSRGPGTIGPDPRKIDPQVIVIAEEYQPFPLELYGHGMHAAVFPLPLDTDHPANRHRVLGSPHIAMAKRYALQHGCLDTILVNRAGEIVGTTEGVVYLVKDGSVIVPPGQPADVVGAAAATLATGAGFVMVEHAVKPVDVLAAEEAFLVGTACGVIGIVRLDGRDIGTGSEGATTQRLREMYRALTRGEGNERGP